MIEYAMPPVISMPSSELDDDVAFTVLNQDNLPITVIGENILKPFGKDNLKQKPNGIVYPTRRFTEPTANHLENNKQKIFTKSNGHINQENLKKHNSLSKSQGNLKTTTTTGGNHQFFDTRFTKTLDAKLRKLQQQKETRNAERKPFVTTVKQGEFLEPPPQIASLIGLKVDDYGVETTKKEVKKLYAYASEPRILNRNQEKERSVHKSKCEAAFKAAGYVVSSVVGLGRQHEEWGDYNTSKSDVDVALPYANLMFDKRVHRGTNFGPCVSSGHLGDGESAAARAAEARRRALARRKAKNQQIRAAQLRLGSPPPVKGRKHEPVQTDLYLEEIFNNPPTADTCTQTELFLERPVSPFYVPAKTGADQETQIYPGDLFDFDLEVQPIIEVLVGKTIEQALIEVLEEEELAAIREQQRRFLEIRAAETAETQRLEEKEKRLLREKERRTKEYEEGSRLQKEMEERIAASVLMQGYMADLLPSVLEGLESEGFLIDSIKEDIDESFMPWLMREVTHEVTEIVSSRDVLTDIVREILENRAEIYKALNRTPPPEPASDEEEAGPTLEEIVLADHLKLQQEISEKVADLPPQN